MKILHRLLMLLVFLGLGGCATGRLGGGPVSGVVRDQTTQQPVPGAIVVVLWKGTVPSWGGAYSVCYHVEAAIADGGGRYHTPAWQSSESEKEFHSRITERYLNVGAYKPGFQFGDLRMAHRGLVYLRPFSGPPREHMYNLHRIGNGLSCGLGGDSEKSLRILYRALYEEGKPLAKSERDFIGLEYWRDWAETLGTKK